ncbi:MraY family glycosyltransferase [Fodinibius sp.]|uniref:MraY family glycosyltransferase n=1 Tax=Fodinibius sp. TaxID=1872440 RepID=UPI002ACD6644|nr:MraY family glycosyltransferase [Fodinibius sp.]MDZ7660556.1 MraY family glycosyltransferase [Fodinibius sp.]
MGFESTIGVILAVVTAFLISYAFMPVIVKIAGLKELIDNPPEGQKKVTVADVPNLGGMGIFAAFLIAFSIWGHANQLESYPFLVASLFMLILTGINDDILELTTPKKLVIQFLASAEIVIAGKVLITNFGGLFGIYEVPFWVGAVVTISLFVLFVNSFKYINEVDVLAGGVGIIISSIFGIWFLGAGFYTLAILSFVIAGALLGFLIYNMHPTKVSLGDTGSLLIGFVLVFISVQFIQINNTIIGNPWHIDNSIIFAFAVMIIPAADILRALYIRLVTGKNPFVKTHIHKRLTESSIMTKAFISISYWIGNLLIIAIAYSLSGIMNTTLMFLTITILGMMLLPATKFLYSSLEPLLEFSDKKISIKNIKQ